jgi:predicted nuclease of restriction endonuclease-like (RecB) superfamily
MTEERLARGKKRKGASFPIAANRAELPQGYSDLFEEIKTKVDSSRLRMVMAANTAMVLLYWEIGCLILQRQQQQGWGAKVIDRLSYDLRNTFPEIKGFSPRNLQFMRAFAELYIDSEIVKQLVSQLPWGHIIILMQKVKVPIQRDWYINQSILNGWSRNILALQISNPIQMINQQSGCCFVDRRIGWWWSTLCGILINRSAWLIGKHRSLGLCHRSWLLVYLQSRSLRRSCRMNNY